MQVTNPLVEQAVNMLKEGAEYQAVIKATGLSKGYVSKIATKLRGYSYTRDQPKKWAGKKLRRLRRLKDAGYTIYEIADIMNETFNSVHMAAWRYGLSVPRPKTKQQRLQAKVQRQKQKREQEREARRKLCRSL